MKRMTKEEAMERVKGIKCRESLQKLLDEVTNDENEILEIHRHCVEGLLVELIHYIDCLSTVFHLGQTGAQARSLGPSAEVHNLISTIVSACLKEFGERPGRPSAGVKDIANEIRKGPIIL